MELLVLQVVIMPQKQQYIQLLSRQQVILLGLQKWQLMVVLICFLVELKVNLCLVLHVKLLLKLMVQNYIGMPQDNRINSTLICYGSIVGKGTITVNLPTSYTTTTYSVVSVLEASSTQGNSYGLPHGLTKSSFKIAGYSSNNNTYHWHAIGY